MLRNLKQFSDSFCSRIYLHTFGDLTDYSKYLYNLKNHLGGLLKKFFGLFFTFVLFFITGCNVIATEDDIPDIFDKTRPMSEEQIIIYDNYVKNLYEATKIAYKKYKFNRWQMKFSSWEASASLRLNKDGVIKDYLLQTHESKVYTLIDGKYVETEDLNKKYNRKDYLLIYSTNDRLPHPIRIKTHLKYRDEFHDRIRNFIENEIPTKPFPKEFIHDEISIRLHIYYTPLDGIEYHGTKLKWKKLDKKYGPINTPTRIPTAKGYISPKPPRWEFSLIKN